MSGLVSVIIPCYNAERWVREAIDSCLAQTHAAIEVVVVDDGSTDRSVEILRSYGDKVILEAGKNRGGNHARNRGFAISRGDFIQYLDADDYLLPDKIEHQLGFLESSGTDVVYSDWRHQHHAINGTITLGDTVQSGAHADVLEALLEGWWVPCCSLLLRREIVKRTGGWDESVTAAQDRDFFVNVAISGARIAYQPGCNSIYRRYGNVTISTTNRKRWLDNHNAVLTNAWKKLEKTDRLTDRYARATAQSYFMLARNYFDLDRQKYEKLMALVFQLDPEFRPNGSWSYNLLRPLFGFVGLERLSSLKRRLFRSRYESITVDKT